VFRPFAACHRLEDVAGGGDADLVGDTQSRAPMADRAVDDETLFRLDRATLIAIGRASGPAVG
jgi:hypothetical protein